jgi:aminopeptidase N
MLTAATTTLDVLGARYGRYPHSALRIAEVPVGWGFGAFALPGMILFTEDRGFLSDPRADDVDLVTRRVAHEVAHQWWGHTLDAVDVPGASLLVETLAKHSEQLVVSALHGERSLAAILAFDEDRYFAGRAQEPDSEPVLLETSGEAYLYYGKGAIVMNGLRDLLGTA